MKVKRGSLIIFLCMAVIIGRGQTSPAGYAAKWKVVDSLAQKKGLTASALAETNAIYVLASKEHNEPQQLKSLIYRISLSGKTKEDATPAAIAGLEKATATAAQPARAILQSLTASEYWLYLEQNRYRSGDRTATAGAAVKDDIATWTIDDLHQKIASLFLESLKDEQLLRRVMVQDYDPVVIRGNMRYLRPTLFDLLTHEALSYFVSGEELVNKPAEVFEIEDSAAFAVADVFALHPFVTPDSLSLSWYALQLFQRLLRWHLGDPSPDALIDVDLARLRFVQDVAVLEDKDRLYSAALARITDRWGDAPAAAEAWYLRARQFYDQGTLYDATRDTAHRYAFIEAKRICEKVLAEKDSSEGKADCSGLLADILKKTLDLNIEYVNLPDQPMRCLVAWSNYSRLYGRIVRIDDASTDMRNQGDDNYWHEILRLPVIRTLSQTLPETGDCQVHRVEIKLDALPLGHYALLASPDSSFDGDQGFPPLLDLVFFHVSSLSFVHFGLDYFVLDRAGGEQVSGANVKVWEQADQSANRQKALAYRAGYTTDANGHFQLKTMTGQRYRTTWLDVTSGKDRLFVPSNDYPYYHYGRHREETAAIYEKEARRTFLFSDRRIYRPGQPFYFKGIVTTRDFTSRLPKLLPGFRTKIYLIDANNSRVDSLETVTNDFGSYHGRFNLPENLLNGNFMIEDSSTRSNLGFSVEEYKRPRFFVGYDTLKTGYRVGDSIRMEGYARGYSGNPVDGALVQYRITRQTVWTYEPYFSLRRGSSVAHGVVRTDKDGKFHFHFVAQPDKAFDKETQPIFIYSIVADVTDAGGETRSGQTSIRAGYQALELHIGQPVETSMPADSLKTLLIRANNLAGIEQPVLVTVAVYGLRSPDRLIRSRYWPAPDQFVMTKEAWLRDFPHDEYGNETEPDKWERTGKMFGTTDSAGMPIPLSGPVGKGLAPGWYLIEASAPDSNNQAVRVTQYVELYDGATGAPARPMYSWDLPRDLTVEPGDRATVSIGSSAENLFVIRAVDRVSWDDPNSDADTTRIFNFLHWGKGRENREFPVTEADRGGFGVLDVFVKDNRFYNRVTAVNVPWSNKDLRIQYRSFRDKTLPGSEEKWELHIRGEKADKASAEVLAGMYDASLDQFGLFGWETPSPYPTYSATRRWDGSGCFLGSPSRERRAEPPEVLQFLKEYDRLLTAGGRIFTRRGEMLLVTKNLAQDRYALPSVRVDMMSKYSPAEGEAHQRLSNDHALLRFSAGGRAGAAAPVVQAVIQTRKDFRETAFFLPDLRTDSEGNVSFSFTMLEAVTSWKWMTLAHTRDLAFGYGERTVITQKELMVQPNVPRFLREGDRMELPVKVINLTDSEMTGQISLELTDPTTGETADGWFVNRQPNQYFTVGPKQSAVVGFPLDIPYQYNRPLTYKVVAQAGNYSDGEEATLPVVSNRLLVTESLPLNMAGDGTKHFVFDKLAKSGGSETLNHHALTVEFTTNPAWYAVQSLPYLMEYPYECSEQTFERLYANALASHIAEASPRLRQVFDRWRVADTAQLLSNLQKNQQLKTVLLEETPWVMEGKGEAQQKKNIALLFDLHRMSRELASAMDRLRNMQSPDGAFPWWSGGPDNRYITQYILTGIGHLRRLNAVTPDLAGKLDTIVAAALSYLDAQIGKDYEEAMAAEARAAKNPKTGAPFSFPIGAMAVHYLYMRSLFPHRGLPGSAFVAVNYFRKKAQHDWVGLPPYLQGMAALALYRTGDIQTAKDIIASLKQNALRDPEQGMYWKGMQGGYYWYQAPVETESLLIEAFHEITGDVGIDTELKTWLLKQKQTHSWATTTATADACYALLMGNRDWLNQERSVEVKLGDKTIDWPAGGGDAGMGYNKKVFDGPFVNPSMGNITVTMQSAKTPVAGGGGGATGGGSPAWGAVYWQYFDMLDRITPPGGSKPALSVSKKLFIRRDTDHGPVLEPLSDNGVLKPGDRVVVRIEVRADRNMEYVHLKDMRAACLEPVNVISQYKWQDGLGYYESTKDASTDFFFDVVPRGTYVLEYELLAGQSGNFSNGITAIQCLYAPEFTYHTEGIRVNVEGGN